MRVIPLQIHSLRQARAVMEALKVDPAGQTIMAPKAILKSFKIKGISSYAANIVKQHLLSLGADAALSRACLVKKMKTDILIFGTVSQLRRFREKIENQPFGLKELAFQMRPYLEAQEDRRFFYARDKKMPLDKCALCGILNITPDSFSGDGLIAGLSGKDAVKPALEKAERMVACGAVIIDVGGESTRPFSRPVSENEELRRVIPVVRALRRKFRKVMISIDTCKYKVARAAAEEGADILNDITALRNSPRMAGLIKKHKLGCILMHMKGTPRTMQKRPVYKGDVVEEIIGFLAERVSWCREKGIPRNRIMIDPGIGFGKRPPDNYAILNRIHELKALDVPVFIGLSRKSFIGHILNDREGERLSGTIAGCIVSCLRGADVLRVHDVREISRALRVVDTIIHNPWN